MPDSYNGTTPTPLVVNFHGFTSNSTQQLAYSDLATAGTERGYIVVTPQGTTLGASGPTWWNILGGGLGVDDVGFVTALLDSLEAELCVDAGRIYSTGISNGAGISAVRAG